MPSNIIEHIGKIMEGTMTTIEKVVNIDNNNGHIDESHGEIDQEHRENDEHLRNQKRKQKPRSQKPRSQTGKRHIQNIYPSLPRTHPLSDSPRLLATELKQFFSHFVKHFLGIGEAKE